MSENNFDNTFAPEVQEEVCVETQEYVKERAKLAGDIRKLFWLELIGVITNAMSGSGNSDGNSLIGGLASLAGLVCSIMLLITLWRMSRAVTEYKTSVYCSIASIVVLVVAVIIIAVMSVFSTAGLVIGIIIALAGVAVSLYGEYKEFRGHSALLSGIDDDFAEKWDTLWGWTIISIGAIVVGLLVAIVILAIGFIIMLAAAIASLVVSIIRIVYLKRMANLFDDLEQKCKIEAAEVAETIEE